MTAQNTFMPSVHGRKVAGPVQASRGAPADAQLEARIAEQAFILQAHPERQARSHAFARLRVLIAQRTPETVAMMEKQKGLAR